MDTIITLTKDIQGIANRLGGVPRNGRIDDREIELWIRHYRETWMFKNYREQKNKFFQARPSLVQDLGCMVLDCVDQSECSNLPTGCFVGKVTIPTPIEIDGAMDYVGVINKRMKFIETPPNELMGRLAQPFSSKFVFFYRIGPNNLYVATRDSELYFDLCYINVRMILADPTEGCYKKSLSTPNCCFNKTADKYPVTGDMMSEIKMWILTREFGIAMQQLKDDQNDGSDNRIITKPAIA